MIFMTETSARKKILFILPRLYPGGAERVLITLMNNISREKFDVNFVSLSGEGTIRHWVESDIKIHSLNKKTHLGGIWGLYKIIKKLKPDTIMSTMIQTNAALLLLKPFFKKMRFIVRESSLPSALIRKKGIKGFISKCIYRYLYPKADLVICPAEIITQQFHTILKMDTTRHRTLYNPVDENRLHSTISDFNFDIEKRRQTIEFICVGRLDNEKGYDRLIEALINFRAPEGYDWRLHIVGKGREIKNLGDLIRQNDLSSHVHLVGHQNTPWPLMAEADCLLLPSRSEGMPNVVLEALACGIPAIGHRDAGGVTEIADKAKPGCIRIAQDMPGFIALMNDVRPRIPTLPIVSSLPEDFKLKAVIARFESFL
jgi:glycosyltransferase involved in cell wall biosynthesis